MPRIAKDEPTRRLNLEVPTSTRERIERLQKATEADSMTEVVRRALLAYEALIDMTGRGGQVVVRKGKSERTLLLV